MTNSDETNSGSSANQSPVSPHDTLFYKTFSNPSLAAAELRSVLPEEVAGAIDWDSLRVEPHRFADSNLNNHFADILLSVSIRQRKTYLHLLFEHSSGPKTHELLQALRYQVRFWEKETPSGVGKEDQPRALSPILTVILHHSETGWRGKRRFAEYFNLDADLRPIFQSYLVDFGAIVDDLSKVDAEALLARKVPPEVHIMLFALRFGRSGRRMLEELPKIAPHLEQVWHRSGGRLVIHSFFVYMRRVAGVSEADMRMALEDTFEPILDPEIAGIWDHFEAGVHQGKREGKREGKLEGLREGVVKGKVDTLRRLMEYRFGQLPRASITQLEKASLKELEGIELRILTATTLEEVLKAPAKRKR